jgi:beta-glucosidase
LNARDLSLVNETGEHIVAEGHYRVSVGGGLPGTQAPSVAASFSIQGQQKLPD